MRRYPPERQAGEYRLRAAHGELKALGLRHLVPVTLSFLSVRTHPVQLCCPGMACSYLVTFAPGTYRDLCAFSVE